MYHGIINVYKEKGFTSFDVIAKMRGICGQKKIGHTGTLDPDAEGVLPVCLGKATKVCELLTSGQKEYEAVVRFGVETDTQDMTGTVLAQHDTSSLTETSVTETVALFKGTQKQIPPMYSALKKDGRKLCDLARAGITVEREPRDITVYDIQILEMRLPCVKIRVLCSKGTYIRTLCHDIGQKLGCGAAMESLLRTQASGFCIDGALTLRQIQDLKENGELQKAIKPLEDIFPDYQKISVSDGEERLLLNGNPISLPEYAEEILENEDGAPHCFRMYTGNGDFVAVYRFDRETGYFKPVKMFLE